MSDMCLNVMQAEANGAEPKAEAGGCGILGAPCQGAGGKDS